MRADANVLIMNRNGSCSKQGSFASNNAVGKTVAGRGSNAGTRSGGGNSGNNRRQNNNRNNGRSISPGSYDRRNNNPTSYIRESDKYRTANPVELFLPNQFSKGGATRSDKISYTGNPKEDGYKKKPPTRQNVLNHTISAPQSGQNNQLKSYLSKNSTFPPTKAGNGSSATTNLNISAGNMSRNATVGGNIKRFDNTTLDPNAKSRRSGSALYTDMHPSGYRKSGYDTKKKLQSLSGSGNIFSSLMGAAENIGKSWLSVALSVLGFVSGVTIGGVVLFSNIARKACSCCS